MFLIAVSHYLKIQTILKPHHTIVNQLLQFGKNFLICWGEWGNREWIGG